jgi:hypothetical protein
MADSNSTQISNLLAIYEDLVRIHPNSRMPLRQIGAVFQQPSAQILGVDFVRVAVAL